VKIRMVMTLMITCRSGLDKSSSLGFRPSKCMYSTKPLSKAVVLKKQQKKAAK
jgi:hypothetical protein